VRAVMTTRTEWTGTASALLGALAEIVGERVAKSKTWPDSPRALAGRLRRAATFMRKIGIDIGFEREGRARTRTINITTIQTSSTPEKPGAEPTAPSASAAPMLKSNPANGFAAQPLRTVVRDADGSDNGDAPTFRANPLKNNAGTAADDADANPPPQSAPEERSPAGHCLGCGDREHAHDPLLPYGVEPTGHVWLHSRCWAAWYEARQAKAVSALTVISHSPDQAGGAGQASAI
jgi:hypothetical protein